MNFLLLLSLLILFRVSAVAAQIQLDKISSEISDTLRYMDPDVNKTVAELLVSDSVAYHVNSSTPSHFVMTYESKGTLICFNSALYSLTITLFEFNSGGYFVTMRCSNSLQTETRVGDLIVSDLDSLSCPENYFAVGLFSIMDATLPMPLIDNFIRNDFRFICQPMPRQYRIVSQVSLMDSNQFSLLDDNSLILSYKPVTYGNGSEFVIGVTESAIVQEVNQADPIDLIQPYQSYTAGFTCPSSLALSFSNGSYIQCVGTDVKSGQTEDSCVASVRSQSGSQASCPTGYFVHGTQLRNDSTVSGYFSLVVDQIRGNYDGYNYPTNNDIISDVLFGSKDFMCCPFNEIAATPYESYESTGVVNQTFPFTCPRNGFLVGAGTNETVLANVTTFNFQCLLPPVIVISTTTTSTAATSTATATSSVSTATSVPTTTHSSYYGKIVADVGDGHRLTSATDVLFILILSSLSILMI